MKKTTFPTRKKILLLDRWQLSRVKRSSGPAPAMTTPHPMRTRITTMAVTMIRATRMEKRPSEGKQQKLQTTRVIQTVTKEVWKPVADLTACLRRHAFM